MQGRNASGVAYFEMSFCPSIELVSLVRRFVGAFYERVLSDADLASRVALATHELLENAVKYSVDGETTIRMEISGPDGHPRVEIRTRNRTAPDHAAILARNIDEMNAIGDPFVFFQNLMKRAAKSESTGGLGLGRIASEAEMTITYEVTGDVVQVVARAQRSEPAP